MLFHANLHYDDLRGSIEATVTACCKARVAESDVFGWSWIPNNTRSRSRIFLSNSDCGYPVGSFFTLDWEFLLHWYNFF